MVNRKLWINHWTAALTLDHDHVDVDGADLRLGQSLAFLQQVRHFLWSDGGVGLGSVGHHLPHGDS